MPDAGGTGGDVGGGKAGWPGAWTFRCYVTPAGRDKINEWYEKAHRDVQAAFDAKLEFLSFRQIWQGPEYDSLSGGCTGLGEIRFKVAAGQYRMLVDVNNFVCVLLYPFKKTRGNADYKTACPIAQDRKALKDGARTEECCFPPPD